MFLLCKNSGNCVLGPSGHVEFRREEDWSKIKSFHLQFLLNLSIKSITLCAILHNAEQVSRKGGSNSLGIPRGRGWEWDEAALELLHRNHSILSSWTAPSLTMQCFKLLIAPTMILHSTAAQTLIHCALNRCSLYIVVYSWIGVHCSYHIPFETHDGQRRDRGASSWKWWNRKSN